MLASVLQNQLGINVRQRGRTVEVDGKSQLTVLDAVVSGQYIEFYWHNTGYYELRYDTDYNHLFGKEFQNTLNKAYSVEKIKRMAEAKGYVISEVISLEDGKTKIVVKGQHLAEVEEYQYKTVSNTTNQTVEISGW
ncbi:MAG TPA: DUF1257 domain-containing protein [Trichocoleus sp.]